MFGVAADAQVGDVGPGPGVALTAAAAGGQGVADTSSSSAGAAVRNTGDEEDGGGVILYLGDWLVARLGAGKVM